MEMLGFGIIGPKCPHDMSGHKFKVFWSYSLPFECRPRVVRELDLIGIRDRQPQRWESGAREIKGIGKGAILNMDHGIKTGREESEGMLKTVKMR